MNTFLPFASFAECARVHPTRALHRQIIEADDCLRHLLNDPTKPPRRKTRHPCVEMWRGHAGELRLYLNTFLAEWMDRNLARAPALNVARIYTSPGSTRFGDDLHATYREHMLAKYGADSTQPDEHFIHASRDWLESPVLHKPFPFPETRP